jgi:hypothetical protein
MSPAQKKLAREMFPRFYQERQQLLDQQTQNLRKLASLKLNGIQSKEDLMLQYMAETGRLDIGPLKNLLNPAQARARERQAQFTRGLLNPRRFVFGDEGRGNVVRRRDRNARAFVRSRVDNPNRGLGFTTGFPPFGIGDSLKGNNPGAKRIFEGLVKGQ